MCNRFPKSATENVKLNCLATNSCSVNYNLEVVDGIADGRINHSKKMLFADL